MKYLRRLLSFGAALLTASTSYAQYPAYAQSGPAYGAPAPTPRGPYYYAQQTMPQMPTPAPSSFPGNDTGVETVPRPTLAPQYAPSQTYTPSQGYTPAPSYNANPAPQYTPSQQYSPSPRVPYSGVSPTGPVSPGTSLPYSSSPPIGSAVQNRFNGGPWSSTTPTPTVAPGMMSPSTMGPSTMGGGSIPNGPIPDPYPNQPGPMGGPAYGGGPGYSYGGSSFGGGPFGGGPVMGGGPAMGGGGCSGGSCSAGGCDGGCSGGSPFADAVNGDGGCCMDPSCCLPSGPRWFGGVAGLFMTRTAADPVRTSLLTADPTGNVLDTRAGAGDWNGGYEARLGHTIGPNHAIEGVFWALSPFRTVTTITDPLNSLRSPIDWGGASFGAQPVGAIFDDAHQHQISRTNYFYNGELNLLCQIQNCSNYGITGMIGARWLRFDDKLQFAAAAAGSEFGVPASTAFYQINDINNMVGGQMGARMYYNLCPRLRVFAYPRVGVMNDYIQNQQTIFRGDGVTAFNITRSKNEVAMLGQIDLGFSVQCTRCLCTFVSYRAMALTNIALSDNQIPAFIDNVGTMNTANSHNSLILHGLVVGGQFVF